MPTKPHLYSTTHQTPVGDLTLIASDQGLRAILWPGAPASQTGHVAVPTTGS